MSMEQTTTRSDGVGWQFWIDRGGTFTDVVARTPDGEVLTGKLLSENPRHYPDAAIEGIRRLLRQTGIEAPIESVKMGTTVATNALLERRGEPTVLVTTNGFRDALVIGYQTRPDLFDLDIELPEMLHESVIEVDERIGPYGEVILPLDEAAVEADLAAVRATGIDSVAILFMHGYRHRDHEERVAAIARRLGFGQVSVSHEVSPLMKLVARGDTTVVDAYLSPILRRYIEQVERQLASISAVSPRVMFMQSNGGLAGAHAFQGKDALLSGPAGGVVGMVRTGLAAGFDRLIGFDMGGTSTDVSHYAGELERTYETEVAGVRVRAPMMLIHTVAAGGGSILQFDGSRLTVGPDSAGADPGPACYGNRGPLAITDCNLMMGRLQADLFPKVFGPGADEPLDVERTRAMFTDLSSEIATATGILQTPEDVAEGFLAIAVENMANAIKKISVQRGYDVIDYTLACFGGGRRATCLPGRRQPRYPAGARPPLRRCAVRIRHRAGRRAGGAGPLGRGSAGPGVAGPTRRGLRGVDRRRRCRNAGAGSRRGPYRGRAQGPGQIPRLGHVAGGDRGCVRRCGGRLRVGACGPVSGSFRPRQPSRWNPSRSRWSDTATRSRSAIPRSPPASPLPWTATTPTWGDGGCRPLSSTGHRSRPSARSPARR